MNIEEPYELTREYQRASAADAGSPAKTTRDAIRAEAREAALRRQPAANDSRYLLRAVAGVAVLGVAVLIWRQQDSRMPIDAKPPEYTVAQKAESAAAEVPAGAPAAAPPAAPATPPAPAPAADAAVANAAAPTTSTESPHAPSRSTVSPAVDNTESERRAESQAFREEALRDSVRTAAPAASLPAAGQSAAAVKDATAVLQDTFTPAQQVAITPPASAWVIRDIEGTVLRSGVVASPDELAVIATSARSDFAQAVSPWTRMPATTSSGRVVDLHVAELQ